MESEVNMVREVVNVELLYRELVARSRFFRPTTLVGNC